MQIISIAAVAKNGVIGNGSEIPWRVPADWDRFKYLTTGHFVVMGRRTFEGLGRPLPRRTTIVVTHHPESITRVDDGEGTVVLTASGVPEAIELARELASGREPGRVCWIAGGADIYRQALPLCTGMDLTLVDSAPEGDVRFPEPDWQDWREIGREPHEGFDWVRYAPVTRTARLLLEPVCGADSDIWRDIHSDPQLYLYAQDDRITDDDEHDRILQVNVRAWFMQGIGYWIVRDRDKLTVLGVGGIRGRVEDGERFWNLYYRLLPDAQGHGYAMEMAEAAIEQVGRIDPVGEVRAIMRPTNQPSRQVAQRLGLIRLEDTVSHDGAPEVVYSGFVPPLLAQAHQRHEGQPEAGADSH